MLTEAEVASNINLSQAKRPSPTTERRIDGATPVGYDFRLKTLQPGGNERKYEGNAAMAMWLSVKRKAFGEPCSLAAPYTEVVRSWAGRM